MEAIKKVIKASSVICIAITAVTGNIVSAVAGVILASTVIGIRIGERKE